MTSYPVHDHLTVLEGVDIYATSDWRKSIIRYQIGDDDEYTETAIYLWHNDGGWSRKNKYVVKTPSAWADDKPIITKLLRDGADLEPTSTAASAALPVSDFYSVTHERTVFKTDGWWKSIVRIDQKGDYDTNEVIVYLWQSTDDGWKRRQKYAIKDLDDWKAESETISAFVTGQNTTATPTGSATDTPAAPSSESTEKSVIGKMSAEIAAEKEAAHLSEHIQ